MSIWAIIASPLMVSLDVPLVYARWGSAIAPGPAHCVVATAPAAVLEHRTSCGCIISFRVSISLRCWCCCRGVAHVCLYASWQCRHAHVVAWTHPLRRSETDGDSVPQIVQSPQNRIKPPPAPRSAASKALLLPRAGAGPQLWGMCEAVSGPQTQNKGARVRTRGPAVVRKVCDVWNQL